LSPTIAEKKHDVPQKGLERRTMADAFYEHKQTVSTQRRMRLGSTKTRGRGEMMLVSEQRGNGGAAAAGGGMKRNQMSLKTRGGRVGSANSRGVNRNADGARIGKRGNVVGAARIKTRGAGGGGGRIRGGNHQNTAKNVDRAGKNNGEHPGNLTRGKSTNNDSENSNTNGKSKNKESMASAIVKAGITLVPIESPAGKNTKAKASK
jgi:hypothetical protein